MKRSGVQSTPNSNAPHAASPAISGDLYNELRALASYFLRDEHSSHTLQPTALVHEVFIRLGERIDPACDPGRFRAAAATAMRRILVDHARARSALKRGGGARSQQLTAAMRSPARPGSHPIDVLALEDALERLCSLEPRHARIAELRFYGGLTVREVAAVLDVSPKTIEKDWTVARAWLYRELSEHATSNR